MSYGGGFGNNFMFNVFPFIFMIVFLLVISIIIINIVRGIGTWSKNNNSPILTVDATVVTKRVAVSHHNHNNNVMNHSANSTRYFATFQVESGDRLELGIDGTEYGMLVEGDKGKLTFQGTRFKEFKRS